MPAEPTPEDYLCKLAWLADPEASCGLVSAASRAAVAWILADRERLIEEACRYYHADGTYEVLGSPGAVIVARIGAAAEVERLRAEVARLRGVIAANTAALDSVPMLAARAGALAAERDALIAELAAARRTAGPGEGGP